MARRQLRRIAFEQVRRLLDLSDADGIVRLPFRPQQPLVRRAFAPGDKLMVTDGPFRGFDALCLEMSSEERLIILINVLGGPTRVELDAAVIVAR
jgi:transcription antitermination factor NusG